MKHILLVIIIGLFLTACASNFQIVKTAIDNKTKTDYSLIVVNTFDKNLKINNHCLYGNCLCDKRILELGRCYSKSIPYLDEFAHIR